jgi:hypothetical protein
MNASSSNFSNQTLDQFLDSIGDVGPVDLVYLYLLPFIGVSGTIFNIINLWIFSHKEFSQPSFFYFRVMSGFHLIDTMLVIAYGICFSPRYLPRVNTYYTALVQLIYIPIGKCLMKQKTNVKIATFLPIKFLNLPQIALWTNLIFNLGNNLTF